MAIHTSTTVATAVIWPDLFGRIDDIPPAASPPRACLDVHLLGICTDFHRLHSALNATPEDDETALEVAWTARQLAADRVATMRPATDAGRRAKASVAVTLLSEVAAWQRDSEVMFALAAFRAEAA